MPITVTSSQGVQLYVLPVPATDWTTCREAVKAIRKGNLIGCPQSIGDISESRAMTEYKCMSSDDSAKALGAISRSTIEIGMLLDPSDMFGQRELRKAFLDGQPRIVGIEYGHTMQYFTAMVSQVSTGIAMDAAITYTATVEISSSIKECDTTSVSNDPVQVVNHGIIVVDNGVPVVN
jgi:hypothetical protein